MSQHQILCGSCKGNAESVPNPKPNDEVTCSRCGRKDRFDHVMRSVEEYVADCAAKSLSDSLRNSMRGNKFVKVTTQSRPQRSYRWISTDLGL